MATSCDFLIVGAGLTGAVIARELHDAGRDVLVLDKRDTVGGNCADTVSHGIRMNLYGPHYFRTNSDRIWEYVRRFAEFLPFEAVVKTCSNGAVYDWPITQYYIDAIYRNGYIVDSYAGMPDFEGECLTKMSRYVYDKFVKGYTECQWGKPATELSKSLASRVEIRQGKDRRLSTKKHQGVPKDGYTQWVSNMLDGIPVELGIDYLERQSGYTAKKCLVFTGAIDSIFKWDLGRLQYRSQNRQHIYYADTERKLPSCQLNYAFPSNGVIREIEWKQIWPSETEGTLITAESPMAGGEEYPMPDRENQLLYQRYRNRVDSTDGLLVEGRMGRNRYLDMDEAIAGGLTVAKGLL